MTDDDGDGLSDSQENRKHTNPLKFDTDGDGVSDKEDFDPLDADVTSDPGFPIFYLIIPLFVIAIIAVVFIALGRGGGVRSDAVGERYKELSAKSERYGTAEEPQPQEMPTSSSESPPPDELTGLEEEIELQDDELADLDEEFEESLSSSPPPEEE
jgi:hypothetical protein